MAEFWVGVKGDLTAEQGETLNSAGFALDDLRLISAGFGIPVQWETMRTCIRVSAPDEARARDEVARALGFEPADLVGYSAEFFR
jgi:hypothetical protein